jgi:AraC family transcriptional regulator of adaptative response/methylated-DNA-[protein]-cysteine methyltransferase
MTSRPKASARPAAIAQSQLAFEQSEPGDRSTKPVSFVELEEILRAHAATTPASTDSATTPVHLAWLDTKVGPMVAGVHEGALVLLEFTDRLRIEIQLDRLKARFKGGLRAGGDPVLEQTERELAEYFAGRRREFTMPLEFPGTPFEERVWRRLLEIPYGGTISYEELALATSTKGAVRAVGSANGRNRIAIVIPCHRVIQKSGGLGGYGGGLWRKRLLLDLEDATARGGL